MEYIWFFFGLFVLILIMAARTNASALPGELVAKSIQIPSSQGYYEDTITYWVKKGRNSDEAAQLIHRTKEKLFAVVRYLSTISEAEIPTELRSGIRTLVRKHLHEINFRELDASRSKTIAYNKDKGRGIYICLRKCRKCDTLGHDDRVFLVALHEIAHSAMPGFERQKNGMTEHGDEFTGYETFLFDTAERLGLIRYADVVGKELCGIIIPDTKRR